MELTRKRVRVAGAALAGSSLAGGIAVAKNTPRHGNVSAKAADTGAVKPAHVKTGLGPGEGTGVQSLGVAPQR